MIWNEIKLRYPGLTNQSIKLSVPAATKSAATAVRSEIRQLLTRFTRWPEFIIEWHMRNLQIAYTPLKTIKDIMSNVRRPPEVNGHVFFIGREYHGPRAAVMNLCSSNIPRATSWDWRNTLESAFKQIPGRIPIQEIQNSVQRCCRHQSRQLQTERWWPTTRDVYTIRKMLQGLVIGPIDKNPGEFSACCPCLYEEALDGMYSEATGYRAVVPLKLTC